MVNSKQGGLGLEPNAPYTRIRFQATRLSGASQPRPTGNVPCTRSPITAANALAITW